jgi:hypothetical protein
MSLSPAHFYFFILLKIKTSEIMMKFSWAIGWVKWLSGEKTNVSKTISVLVLRVLVS